MLLLIFVSEALILEYLTIPRHSPLHVPRICYRPYFPLKKTDASSDALSVTDPAGPTAAGCARVA